MNTLYAVLGHTPTLSLLELSSLTESATLISPTLAKLQTLKSVSELGSLLGGSLKLITPIHKTTSVSLLQDLTAVIAASDHKNVAVTNLAPSISIAESELYQIKKDLSRPIRFLSLAIKDHSLVALRKQHVAEFVVVLDGDNLVIGQTTWIQDADDWTLRDRKKPYRDIKRGMLPPKIARIMVNLACQGKVGLSVGDPFCGTGTTLAEGALVGCKELFGGDTNQVSVDRAPANLDWLISEYKLQGTRYWVLKADATHFDEQVKNIDCIVTEPYMGPLLESDRLPSEDKLKNIARGLTKLYIGALKSWHKVLAAKGRVVISIPQFILGSRTIFTLHVDDYARLGYNYISSVAYSKKDATVIRNITILEKSLITNH